MRRAKYMYHPIVPSIILLLLLLLLLLLSTSYLRITCRLVDGGETLLEALCPITSLPNLV